MTNIEKETIINFNEAEPEAEVYTHNRALQRKLDKLCRERPDEVKISRCSVDSSKTYLVPKVFIKVTSTRKLSRKTEIKAVENLKRARAVLQQRKAGDAQ